ncbi:transcriptional regulator [Chroococcidiopsis cubana SAG 39.79]|jgi:DeoR family transcriptional regulator, suf operon transcriptional repressor|nr:MULTISPECIES: iron-sulfur cluster biosynthesis transcriptional regulator SufR [Chroococcidiopsis]RUT12310.1 transcriptional regulator [Chroococcidiopsis cubana SAG 39.79]URD52409.1 iron-sulfur cluster biosynthesis transcriptional regulator SufR [Chroococcidiopsis sp. CCNUC1]
MTMVTTQQPSTKQDILQYLMKQGQATAQELATELDVSPQAIRRHLKDLEAEELIVYQAVHLGMGRPQHVYKLSDRGRDRLRRTINDGGGDSHGQFAVSLLDTLAQTVGREQMGTILRMQWERKALEYRDRVGEGSLQERVANLVELRKAEGYMAEWYFVNEENSARGFIITEHNCAIANVAESFPVVCGHELEMFATVLPDCQVERTHWIIDGEHRCGYLVRSTGERGKL